jgi:hypothetical protein
MRKALFTLALLASALILPLTAHADTIDDFMLIGNGENLTSPSLQQGSTPSINTSIASPRAVPEQLAERLAPWTPHFSSSILKSFRKLPP